MAYDILVNGKDVSTMEIQNASTTKKYDADRCKALGIEVPDGFETVE